MERNFVIMTDTASDLPESYYEEHDVKKVMLGYTMDDVTYGEDGAWLDVKEFYARLRGGAMPKTFQVTPEQARRHMEPVLAAGNDLLVAAFSSGLSGTCNSYRLTAEELMKEYPGRRAVVVDSLCASLGQGLFVDYLVKKADSGATLDETAAYAEEIRSHMCHFFTVDNLFHLHRGGRVSATTAVVGSMLKIKPVLHVDDEGHLIAIGKAMGRKKSISALVEKLRALGTLTPEDPIFISHGDCPEDVDYLLGLIEKEFGTYKIVINEIGPVIGAHSGPGTVALFFMGAHR